MIALNNIQLDDLEWGLTELMKQPPVMGIGWSRWLDILEALTPEMAKAEVLQDRKTATADDKPRIKEVLRRRRAVNERRRARAKAREVGQ